MGSKSGTGEPAPRSAEKSPGSHQRTWAENGFFPCSHSMGKNSCTRPQCLRRIAKRSKGCAVFFSPCTPRGPPGQVGRTWATRPGRRASVFPHTTATPRNSRRLPNLVSQSPFAAAVRPIKSNLQNRHNSLISTALVWKWSSHADSESAPFGCSLLCAESSSGASYEKRTAGAD